MSSIQLTTKTIEPIYHSNQRTRFKLQSLSNGILPNIRLCNVSVSDIQNGAVPAYYGANSGALGLVKQMTLSEKGNPIESLTMKAAEYLSFLNATKSTQDIEDSIRTITIKSRNNLVTAIDQENVVSRADPVANLTASSSRINTNSSNSARFDLQQYFNFLANEDVLVGFKDLELLIEWETDTNKIFEGTRGGGRPTGWTIDEPILVFEMILDKDLVEELAMSKRGQETAFITPELEILSIPATGGGLNGIPVTSKLRLQSAKNKTVRNLLVAVHDNVLIDSQETCQNNSRAQPSEVWQVYVNNASLFTNPLDNESRKLACLEDSFGKRLTSWFQIRALYEDNDDYITDGGLDGAELGNMSYFGCDINDVVTDLRIELTRTRDATTAQGGNALTLNCFSMVQKYCVYTQTGEIIISYRRM